VRSACNVTTQNEVGAHKCVTHASESQRTVSRGSVLAARSQHRNTARELVSSNCTPVGLGLHSFKHTGAKNQVSAHLIAHFSDGPRNRLTADSDRRHCMVGTHLACAVRGCGLANVEYCFWCGKAPSQSTITLSDTSPHIRTIHRTPERLVPGPAFPVF
jgi:hypothetical protein